ncbi:MAG: pilus assembly protein [Acidobacteriia bacterium]|nr:pilus assembly protein [Terriglobia bacterium]
MLPVQNRVRRAASSLPREEGSALVEFAIALPLLVVFIVGIYDFSGAFNQKQKIEQAAQDGAIIAGAQPMSDIASTTADPESLRPVVRTVFNSLAHSGVLPNAGASCSPPPPIPTPPTPPALVWTYTISGCPDDLVITIDRGGVIPVTGLPMVALGTTVQVSYPYHWRFGSAIQLLFPGPNGYGAPVPVTEQATVHNQN